MTTTSQTRSAGRFFRSGWQGLRWYLKEVTGEARWEEYVARCAREGRDPMSRRAWERHRADQREHQAAGRCC